VEELEEGTSDAVMTQTGTEKKKNNAYNDTEIGTSNIIIIINNNVCNEVEKGASNIIAHNDDSNNNNNNNEGDSFMGYSAA
jgi:hypothetical protein